MDKETHTLIVFTLVFLSAYVIIFTLIGISVNMEKNDSITIVDSQILQDLKNNEYTCLGYHNNLKQYTALKEDCLDGRCKNIFYRWDENFNIIEVD